MTEEQARAKFPAYFANFEIPKWAKEQMLEVYRRAQQVRQIRDLL